MARRWAVHRSLDSLLSRYDGLLLDQWGVIHNGTAALPGAPRALSGLGAAGKKVVVLSNSTRRAGATLGRLAGMGFDPAQLSGSVTSGEVNWRGWADGSARWAGMGRRCIMLGNKESGGWLEGLQIEPTDAVEQAEFVLAMGLEALFSPDRRPVPMEMCEFDQLLERCRARGLPMLCGNPDKYTVHPDGSLSPVVGLLAEKYASLGGEVTYVGKPEPEIFEAGLAELKAAGVADKARIAHVGDSLHHDVAGAARAGIDSVFVCGGVHYEELEIEAGPQQGEGPSEEALERLFEKHGITPTHVLLGFVMDS